jgi:D-aminoacyl-tRNA deacylase
MRLIVTSQKDLAGINIYNCLSDQHDFKEIKEFERCSVFAKDELELIATQKSQVNAGHLDSYFNAEYYIFASRHRSASNRPVLTVHTPGNFLASADLGGQPKDLAFCNAVAVKKALQELLFMKSKLKLKYDVCLEGTHHGPTELRRPVLFVEVGSTKEQWNDDLAVKAVSMAVLAAAENSNVNEIGIGIGGNHYAPLHTRLVLQTDIALGHIIPSYIIDELTIDMFYQAVSKSNATFGFLDWKGMNKSQREKIKEFASCIDLPLKRGRDFLKSKK